MGYFTKKNKALIGNRLLKKSLSQDVIIDQEKQDKIVEDVIFIHEKREIKKMVTPANDQNVIKQELFITKNTEVVKEKEIILKEEPTVKEKEVVLKKGSVVVSVEKNFKNLFKKVEGISGINLTSTYNQLFNKDGKNIDNLLLLTDKITDQLSKKNIVRSFISLEKLQKLIKNKTIILVANSSDLLDNKNGSLIDSHDIVVRFNSFKIDPEHTGSKTTIHTSVYLQDINLDCYVPIRFIVSNSLNNWVKKIESLNKFNQGLLLKYNHHNDINGQEKDKKPTTSGFVMLTILLKLGGFDKINLIGFNFYEKGMDSILRTDEGVTYDISKVHDYDFEKSTIMKNANEYDNKNNIITFYDNSTL